MLNDFHVLDLLPAYALGSLEEEEARLVAEHLAGCYRCRAEQESYQRVADQLSLAVPDASPPQELKSRLMERIQSVNVKRPSRSVLRRFPQRLIPVGAFAVLLIIGFAFSNILLWQKINSLEVLTGPQGMRAIALSNTGEAPEASGFVVVGADGRNGVLVVDKLPRLDAAHEYQAWLVRDGTNTSSAVFSVDETGYRGVRIDAPQSLMKYSSVRITIEPAGGSDAPTGREVLSGSLFNP